MTVAGFVVGGDGVFPDFVGVGVGDGVGVGVGCCCCFLRLFWC